MAAPHRRTTVTVTEGAGAAPAPGAPSTTLAQWTALPDERALVWHELRALAWEPVAVLVARR